MKGIVGSGDLYWTKAGKPKSTGASTMRGGSRLCTLPCDDTAPEVRMTLEWACSKRQISGYLLQEIVLVPKQFTAFPFELVSGQLLSRSRVLVNGSNRYRRMI